MSTSVDEARLLVAGIAHSWTYVAPLLGERRGEFEAQLVIRLRDLDAALTVPAGDDRLQAAYSALTALFRTEPRAQEQLDESLDEIVGARNQFGGSRPSIPGLLTHQRYVEIPVLFGTDRAPGVPELDGTGRITGGEWFTGRRNAADDASYGVVWVSIPDDHRMGALEKPRWWRLQFREDPARHVVALRHERLTRPRFVALAADLLSGAADHEALMFVHGYNVTFADAARRAAQLAYDLNFTGLPMLYSWASAGTPEGYHADENSARWATPHLIDHLRLALSEIGADRVHVIAHSMGNRLLTEALVQLPPDLLQRLGQLVFAAPDVDAGVFTQLAKAFTAMLGAAGSPRRTLYASSNDKALLASRFLTTYPRAGQSGPDIVVVAHVDTIDATELDTGLMGHSYFGDRTSVLCDLFYVIRGQTPAGRFGLRPKTSRAGLPYWIFNQREA